MVSGQRITANTSFFMTALVLQKVLSFVYFTILARAIGAEGIGQYFFAISFASMFSVLVDLGLSPLLIREVAKGEDNAQKWFQQIFTLKVIFAVLTVLILFILNTVLYYSDPVRNLIYLTTAIIVLDSFTLLFYAYIRGKQSLKFESWGTIIFQLIVLAIGISLLQITDNVLLFLLVLFIASLFNMIFSGAILIHKFKVKIKFYFSKSLARKILLIALPFALAAIFAKVYAYIDTFLLKMFMGDEEVGFYSVAYKITFALQFIPLAFVASLYPAFSHYFKDDYERLKQTFIKSFNYLAFIAIPVAFGVIALADKIVPKLYTSEFSFSILPLQVLIASIPFLFVNFSLSSFLNATNRQKINTRNLGIVMVFNILANLLLIPRLGIWGAALSSSLSTLLLFSLNLAIVLKVIKVSFKHFVPILGAIFSSIIMFFIVWYFKDSINWIFMIIIGGVVYLFLMLITRSIKFSDIWSIKKSFSKNS